MLKKGITVPARSHFAIPVEHGDLPSGDYMFEPSNDCPVALYAALVDSAFHAVLARNDTDRPIRLPKKLRVGEVMDLEADGCYHIDESENAHELAARLPKQKHYDSWAAKAFASLSHDQKISLNLFTASHASTRSSYAPTLAKSTPGAWSQKAFAMLAEEDPYIGLKKPSPLETVLPNGVTVHGSGEASRRLAAVVTEFADIWVDKGTSVNLPQEDWMRIPLKAGWESKITGRPKVYPLGIKDRATVDEVFDKLQAQGRLVYTKQPTPFCFPVFVVHKTLPDGTKHGRPVVDIRMLNQVSVRDAYPLPLQSDVIWLVSGCRYITCVDGAWFFYQWRVHPLDQYKFTVVTYRGQETFLVPLMGYCNSPVYVQRQIDRLLRPFKAFAKGYVDDIVIFSETLEEHISHLRQVFALFRAVGVILKAIKSFIGYPNVQLLGQRVDSFGLSTPSERLQAISRLMFPRTLAALETYLGMTGYLRNYIAWYAQIARPLQDRKTELLKPSPKGGRERKAFSATTRLVEPTAAELESFATLQALLSKPSYLTHFSPNKVLYIDIDASKDFGFGVVVYHDWEATEASAKATSSDTQAPDSTMMAYTTKGRKKIRPIMFLSRLLTDAERNYWPTELEVACLVWTVRKIRHLVESSRSNVVVFTDHSATIDIAKQSSLNSVSTVRLNLRLVRASQYLQRFELDVRHKLGKRNVIPDALSRLASTNDTHTAPPDHAELDALYTYTTTLVGMSEDFKRRITEGYQADPSWTKILDVLYDNERSEDAARLSFVLGEDDDDTTVPHDTAPHDARPRTPSHDSLSDRSDDDATAPYDAPIEAQNDIPAVATVPKPRLPEASESRAVAVRVPSKGSQRAIAVRVPVKPSTADAFPSDDANEPSRNRLIYHIDKATGVRRLCIPQSVVKEVLDIAHTAEGHLGFARCFERVAHSWYIRGLTRHLRDYLKHCPECLVYQTRRHSPYGSMQPIYSPPIPFHTLTIDFILALPLTSEGFDSVMSVTCKFSKRVTLAPGKTIWKAYEWAAALLKQLELGDWGLPKVILSDRDPKFLSDLWTGLFN